MSENAVTISHVSKNFNYTSSRAGTLKTLLTGFLKSKGEKQKDVQHALKDINFDIKKGEFFGIVGRNGSGKSTLLKMIAGIYQPNKGKITVQGKLVPFIELGVGFNPFSCIFLSCTTNLANHNHRVSIVIFIESFQDFDKVQTLNRVAAQADTSRLPYASQCYLKS